jgi:hypothetical protein
VFHSAHILHLFNEELYYKFIDQNHQNAFHVCSTRLNCQLLDQFWYNSQELLNEIITKTISIGSFLGYYIMGRDTNVPSISQVLQKIGFLANNIPLTKSRQLSWKCVKLNMISLYINNYWTDGLKTWYSPILAYKSDRLEELREYPFTNF